MGKAADQMGQNAKRAVEEIESQIISRTTRASLVLRNNAKLVLRGQRSKVQSAIYQTVLHRVCARGPAGSAHWGFPVKLENAAKNRTGKRKSIDARSNCIRPEGERSQVGRLA